MALNAEMCLLAHGFRRPSVRTRGVGCSHRDQCLGALNARAHEACGSRVLQRCWSRRRRAIFASRAANRCAVEAGGHLKIKGSARRPSSLSWLFSRWCRRDGCEWPVVTPLRLSLEEVPCWKARCARRCKPLRIRRAILGAPTARSMPGGSSSNSIRCSAFRRTRLDKVLWPHPQLPPPSGSTGCRCGFVTDHWCPVGSPKGGTMSKSGVTCVNPPSAGSAGHIQPWRARRRAKSHSSPGEHQVGRTPFGVGDVAAQVPVIVRQPRQDPRGLGAD
jgi:hypothetical protein